jgi:hypothetical protein
VVGVAVVVAVVVVVGVVVLVQQNSTVEHIPVVVMVSLSQVSLVCGWGLSLFVFSSCPYEGMGWPFLFQNIRRGTYKDKIGQGAAGIDIFLRT